MPESPDPLTGIRDDFSQAYTRIEGLASAQHRGLRGDRKEEAVAETVAIAWSEYRKLALAGRDVVKLLGKIVEFAALRVRCGRGFVNNAVRDVMSARCRFRHGYAMSTLPLSDREPAAAEVIAAASDSDSPADRAALNADFEAWLGTLEGRRREVAEQLASGLNTVEVGRRQGVTRARIHQLRKDLTRSWEEFHGGGTARDGSGLGVRREAL